MPPAAALRAAVLAVALRAALSSFAPFSVARSFSEHAVLQAAPRTARVWGWTTPSGVVNATLNCSAVGVATTFSVTASGDEGLWVAEFPPVPASTHACVVAFLDVSSTAQVWFLDILFGEVLVCGGQRCVGFAARRARRRSRALTPRARPQQHGPAALVRHQRHDE